MKILYFAWLRDQVGHASETVTPPEDQVRTVGDLIAWLKALSPGHEKAFADTDRLRFAVNQDYAKMDTAVGPRDEVAFFPPVTGG
ncbi:molybdopterin converting factor subunit 1 [Caenispirillum salinarum]|uniref:molybdopterin converting factor subunit 1 n=1 Tax=Caenispirillum salinarum TaxID=859058 RepID=UPI00384C1D43